MVDPLDTMKDDENSSVRNALMQLLCCAHSVMRRVDAIGAPPKVRLCIELPSPVLF